MFSETSLSGSERLHTIVVSLEMEITDSILAALRHEVKACRQEQKEQLIWVDPILIALDSVARHLDEIPGLADIRALTLLNELVDAYHTVTEKLAGQDTACQTVISEALTKVFDWQHSCIQEGGGKVQESHRGGRTAPVGVQENMQGVQELLATVQEEITATGMMAVRESASLLELAHVQNDALAAQGLTGEIAKADKADNEAGEDTQEALSSLIQGSISSLQQAFHQEMERLRYEIVQDDLR